MFLNNQQVTEEIKREIKKFLETTGNENTTTQNLWECSKSSPKREVYSNAILPQEIRKTSNRQPNLIPKATRKKKKDQKTLKLSRRKKIMQR